MKRLLLTLFVLLLTACTAAPAEYRQVSMDEAIALMARETDYLILDVRRPDEFAAGQIKTLNDLTSNTIYTGQKLLIP